jgi:hypothetical protein
VQKHRVELLLFVLLWGTFAYFYQSTQQNEAARFDQTRAIAQEHRLAIDDYWWNSADVIRYTKNGRDYIYPNKAPGTTLLAVPFFWVITHLLKPFMAVGLPEWVYWHMVAYLTIIFTISLLSALSAIAIYRVLMRITDDAGFSVFAVLAIWLGTMAFPFSTLFFSHQQAAALLAIAFSLLFALRSEVVDSARLLEKLPLPLGEGQGEGLGAKETPGYSVNSFARDPLPGPLSKGDGVLSRFNQPLIFLGVAGALMGFSVTTEYPTALLVVIISVYGLWVINRAGSGWRAKGKLLAAFVLGLVIGSGFLLWYNIAAFGKIFYVPYEAYSKADSSFPVYSRGFLGLRWPGFGQFLHALAAITIKPPIGMLYIGVEHWRLYASSPVLWLAIPGVAIMLWRRRLRPEGLVVTAMIVIYLLFVTSYGNSIYDWSGAAYIGPRHIIPLLPFLALPIYYGGRKLRFVFYPLLAISVFYMLLATAIEPRVPFPFENPARDSFLPDYLHSRLAQNTDALFDPGHRKLTVDSTAFNLAKLARVPRSYQLAPLMSWWLIVGGALLVAAASQSQLTQFESADEAPKQNLESEQQEDVNQ